MTKFTSFIFESSVLIVSLNLDKLREARVEDVKKYADFIVGNRINKS